jgi:hypothetical protein
MDMNKKYGNHHARNARGAGFITSRIKAYKKAGIVHDRAKELATYEWNCLVAENKVFQSIEG